MASGRTSIEEYTVEEYNSDCGISITAIVDARIQFVGVSPAAEALTMLLGISN